MKFTVKIIEDHLYYNDTLVAIAPHDKNLIATIIAYCCLQEQNKCSVNLIPLTNSSSLGVPINPKRYEEYEVYIGEQEYLHEWCEGLFVNRYYYVSLERVFGKNIPQKYNKGSALFTLIACGFPDVMANTKDGEWLVVVQSTPQTVYPVSEFVNSSVRRYNIFARWRSAIRFNNNHECFSEADALKYIKECSEKGFPLKWYVVIEASYTHSDYHGY